MDLATNRLVQERKEFTKNRPFGCTAKPMRKKDGSVNLFEWECSFLADDKSIFATPGNEIGYRVLLHFPSEYPEKPPIAQFSPPIFHPNVFPNGNVCLSILLESGHHKGKVASHWSPDTRIATILSSLRTFLDEENPNSVANPDACSLYLKDLKAYKEKVKADAAKYPKTLEDYIARTSSTSSSSTNGNT